MKIAKKQEDEIGFQLAPMIDMTFLLLIFFMVTTKISKDQVKVDIKLPTAANASIPNDLSNRDIISIDGTGQYYIGQVPASKKELTAHLKDRPPPHLCPRRQKHPRQASQRTHAHRRRSRRRQCHLRHLPRLMRPLIHLEFDSKKRLARRALLVRAGSK